jgi:hypothetical protein
MGRSAGRLLARGPEAQKSLSKRSWRYDQVEHRAACEHRQRRQRRWPSTLRVGTRRIWVSAMMMSAVIVSRMVIATSKHLRLAQHECESSIDRRKHEARRNERAHEKHPEDEPCRPPRICAVPHPCRFSEHLGWKTPQNGAGRCRRQPRVRVHSDLGRSSMSSDTPSDTYIGIHG